MKLIALELDDGQYSILAWTDKDLSKRELKRAAKRFLNDSDVVGVVLMDWCRFYDDKREAKAELPKY